MHVLQILLHNSYVLYNEFYRGRKSSHYDYCEKFINYLCKNTPSTPINNENLKKDIYQLKVQSDQIVHIAKANIKKEAILLLNVKNVMLIYVCMSVFMTFIATILVLTIKKLFIF